MRINALLLGTVALSLAACSTYSAHMKPDARNPSRHHMQTNRLYEQSYEKYERREPCQYYREVPGSYYDHCQREKAPIFEEAQKESAMEISPYMPPVLNTYTILFDFDHAEIRPNEQKTLDRIARELKRYQPGLVTVTGYADSSGKKGYNRHLSSARQRAVSKALLDRGIPNQIIDGSARGENDQAVPTADGVRNQENRRVVVDFRH